jgi:hypothetical protein
LPPWVIKTIKKICHHFFRKGADNTREGNGKVAWDLVCKPKMLGSLGMHNLQALRASLVVPPPHTGTGGGFFSPMGATAATSRMGGEKFSRPPPHPPNTYGSWPP